MLTRDFYEAFLLFFIPSVFLVSLTYYPFLRTNGWELPNLFSNMAEIYNKLEDLQSCYLLLLFSLSQKKSQIEKLYYSFIFGLAMNRLLDVSIYLVDPEKGYK